MSFIHEPIDLGYEDLTATTSEGKGRVYKTPDGEQYPSVTTVLSILSREAIQAWRSRVGEKEANKISRVASSRGTAVHAILEKYVDNDPNYTEGYMPHIIQSFQDVKHILDNNLDKVYSQEAPLYSQHLELAGRVDCVGVWNGVNSIIDYKTSRKPKKKEWITGYFLQCAAYAIMWEERTGMPITQLVIMIAVDNEDPQVFIEHRDNWTDKLWDTIKQYQKEKRMENVFGR